MNSVSKKTTVILLAIASLILSRLAFLFVNDPEGPNLLVVVGLAGIIYLVFLMVFFIYAKRPNH